MKREFVRTATFERSWAAIGLGEEDAKHLEDMLLEDPKAGDVIPHMNGARKLRFPLSGRGKSGGARVIYVDILIHERIYLLLAYPKNVQTDLNNEQRKIICSLINALKEE